MQTSDNNALLEAIELLKTGSYDSVKLPEEDALSRELNNLARILSEKEKETSRYMGTVAHDIRSPMTSVAGFAEGMLDGTVKPEQYPKYLKVIADEARRLSVLVEELLGISRLESGKNVIKRETFEMCETVRLVIISLEEMIEDKKLDVKLNLPDNMLVFADKDAIHRVIYNLCQNAVKFSDERGLFEVSVSDSENGKCLISVYNTGRGISENELPHVFDKFFRAERERELDKTGTGLGLSIVKAIVDAHGERIFAESKEGEYCRFTFTLERA